jgi:hypothetical protein
VPVVIVELSVMDYSWLILRQTPQRGLNNRAFQRESVFIGWNIRLHLMAYTNWKTHDWMLP